MQALYFISLILHNLCLSLHNYAVLALHSSNSPIVKLDITPDRCPLPYNIMAAAHAVTMSVHSLPEILNFP